MRWTLVVLLSIVMLGGTGLAANITVDSQSEWSSAADTINISVNNSRIELQEFRERWTEEDLSLDDGKLVPDTEYYSGYYYVMVQGVDRIYKINGTTGAVVKTASQEVGNLNRMAIDSSGNVYAGSKDSLKKYDSSLNEITVESWPVNSSIGAEVIDVSLGADYVVTVAANGDVQKWDKSTGGKESINSLNGASEVKVVSGDIYLGVNEELRIYDSNLSYQNTSITLNGTVSDIENDGDLFVSTGDSGSQDFYNIYRINKSLSEIKWSNSNHIDLIKDISVGSNHLYSVAAGKDDTLKRHDIDTGRTVQSYNFSEQNTGDLSGASVEAGVEGVTAGITVKARGYRIRNFNPNYTGGGKYISKTYDTGDKAHEWEYLKLDGDLKSTAATINVTTFRNSPGSGSNVYHQQLTFTSSSQKPLNNMYDRYMRFNVSLERNSTTSTPGIDLLEFGYRDNPPPKINSHSPVYNSSKDPTDLEVNVSDPDGGEVNVTIYNGTGYVLNNTNVTGSGNVTAKYGNLSVSTNNTWSVNTTVDNLYTEKTFEFKYDIPPGPQDPIADVKTDSNYSAIIGSGRTPQLAQITIENPDSIGRDFQLTLSASSTSPSFVASGSSTHSVSIPANSEKHVLMLFPTSSDDTVKLEIEDQSTGITKTESFNVRSFNVSRTESRQIPGINGFYFILIGIAATAYSLLL